MSVRAGSAWAAAFRLVAGSTVAAGLWLAVDLVRGEAFLGELWAALPPQHENAVKALLLVWFGGQPPRLIPFGDPGYAKLDDL
jgi:hypothetical protein